MAIERPKPTNKPVDHDKIMYGSTQYQVSNNSIQSDGNLSDYLEISYDKDDEEEDFDVLISANDQKVVYSKYQEKEVKEEISIQPQPMDVKKETATTVSVASTNINFNIASTTPVQNQTPSNIVSNGTKYHVIQAAKRCMEYIENIRYPLKRSKKLIY